MPVSTSDVLRSPRAAGDKCRGRTILRKIARVFHRYIVNTHKIVHKMHAKCLHYACMFAIIKTVKRGTLTIRSTQ